MGGRLAVTVQSDMLADTLATLVALGTTCTLHSVVSVYDYDDGGTVTETVTDYTANCSDLVDESRRYGDLQTDLRATGTFYLAASGLSATPKAGDRVTYRTRVFAVLAVMPYSVQGGVVAWRLDTAEQGAS